MSLKKKTYLLAFAAVASLTVNVAYAQANKQTDSLIKAAAGEIYVNPDNVIRVGQKILSQSRSNVDYQIKAYKMISDAYSSKRDYEKSLRYVTKASALLDRSNDALLKISIVNKTGILYHQLKVYDKAIQYLDQAEQLIAKYPVKDSIHIELAKNYIVRGFIYKQKLSCTIAIDFLDRGISELQKSKNEPAVASKISIAKYNKGNCYLILKNNKSALENFLEAAQMAREDNSKSLEAFALKGSAEVYTLEGKNADAIDALDKAMHLSAEVNDLILNKTIYRGLAENYLATNQWEQFKTYQQKFMAVQKLMTDRERNSVSESLKVKEKELFGEQLKCTTKFYYSLAFICLISMLTILFFAVLIRRKRAEIEKIKAQIQILQNKKGERS
jgi:tetratricopeptide (TPR) repeat protein